ncbi:VWA domain-containing protein [Sporosarcina sp. ACRSM]|uniref:vWA domain-containing protein n=1 Tax=Sporosarcina sp. ACRSM TaxID=2918216 RepID=UPI001EF51FE0|nr:VWA domain-containing protein [Sporosarcina sp. ACRSM]MCG7334402.1 VWA domain-containing protein [Sporosarcina sp. ACRSM]
MVRKWWLGALLVLALIVGGCSEKGTADEQEPSEDVAQGEEDVIEEVVPEPKAESELDLIRKIEIPDSEESFRAQEPGIFTADIPYEKETAQVWGFFGLGDYKEELTAKLAEVTAETQDPEDLFKALHYYIGSNAYGQAATNLDDYSVAWFEPYLPEPGEMQGQEGEEVIDPGKTFILLDASSSMLLNVEGKQKMGIAKKATGRFATTIGGDDDIALVAYGHVGTQNKSDKELSCTTIEDVYPLQKYDSGQFAKALNDVQAKGWTPLANAIEFVRDQMEGSTDNVTLYIVSDGAETCGGDPVAAAQAFAGEDDRRAVNIIGFDVDTAGENQLKDVAAAGNGEYISAKTIDELDNSIETQWLPSLQDIMSKSNSLINHWGQSWDETVTRSGLSDRFFYATINEADRFNSAISIMQSEKMIPKELADELKTMVKAKDQRGKEIKNVMDKRKMEQDEADRQAIIKRVDEWTDRMFELKDTQGQ